MTTTYEGSIKVPKTDFEKLLADGAKPMFRVKLTIDGGDSPQAPANEQIPVVIESEPIGADVSLDAHFVGNTPLLEFKMSPGEHLLEIAKTGFITWSRRILVVAGAPTHVKATLEVATAPEAPGH